MRLLLTESIRRSVVCLTLTCGISAVCTAANVVNIPLGPVNPGAEQGLEGWFYSEVGQASVSIDNQDSASGRNDFEIANAASGPKQHAHFRSQTFSLRHVAETGRPITFSFSYKLPGRVKRGDNIALYLEFCEEGGATFSTLGHKTILVGSSTGDSGMDQYKTITVSNIVAPPNAITADICVTANESEPWTSGEAQFDDFSVTAAPKSWKGGVAGMAALLIGTLYVHRTRGP